MKNFCFLITCKEDERVINIANKLFKNVEICHYIRKVLKNVKQYEGIIISQPFSEKSKIALIFYRHKKKVLIPHGSFSKHKQRINSILNYLLKWFLLSIKYGVLINFVKQLVISLLNNSTKRIVREFDEIYVSYASDYYFYSSISPLSKITKIQKNINKNKVENRKMILIMQPLVEDGILSIVEFVRLLKFIKKSQKYPIIVRFHPRNNELIKNIVKKYFKTSKIKDPIEDMSRFEYVGGFFSSLLHDAEEMNKKIIIYNFRNKSIDFLKPKKIYKEIIINI